jgi:rhomboid protease GluP
MTDTDSSSDQLDQLFAAQGVAPSVPTAKLPFDTLPSPEAAALPSADEARIRAMQRFHGLLQILTPLVWVTPLLLLSNVVIYLIMATKIASPLAPTAADLVLWGANYAPMTWSGQTWRLVSSLFLHGGVLHLAVNMWALWNTGRFLERLVGNIGLLIIYFASGIAASVLSLWWNGDVVSVGASGAIFGLMGALLTFIWNRTETFPQADIASMRGSLVTFIGFNLLFGTTIGGIDQAAHIGGLLSGLICGFLLSQPLDQQTRQRRLSKNAMTAAVAALAIGIMIFQHPAPPPDFFQETKAYDQLVPGALKNFVEMYEKWDSKKVSAKRFASWLEKDLLPPWRKVREHLESLSNVPAGRRDLLHQMRADLINREEGWDLLIEALRRNDQGKFDAFLEKQKQANLIEQKLYGTP